VTGIRRPVHVVPEAEHQMHARTESCRCRPAVERWTVEGRTQTRIVHRPLNPDPPRAEDVLPGPGATHHVHESP
jgi:hypothetical protein